MGSDPRAEILSALQPFLLPMILDDLEELADSGV
jgi:hypothetical protein